MQHKHMIGLALGLAGIFAQQARADFVFTFSGEIVSGQDSGGASLMGSAFTFSMLVSDLAADLTPGTNTGNYLLSSVAFDLGSDGTIEEAFAPDASTSPVLYIDAGSTQLVGAFDLGGAFATFLMGVHLPAGAFADPHDLTGQGAFALTGLTSSTYSFYQSAGYNLVLNLDAFGFASTVTVVPLPPAALAGGTLLALGVGVRGVRSRRG